MASVPRKKASYVVRPPTAVLTRGFDPRLSVGSARPAVFRSSTYVFSSPEAAERAFRIALGKAQPVDGESVDLIYARLSHPNAEILEDQIVPLEPGARAAAVFNSGMAAISTLFLAFCHPGASFIYTTPLYGGSQHLIHQLLEPLGMHGIPVPGGDTPALQRAIQQADNLRLVFVETPANPTLRMTDIRAVVKAARQYATGTPSRAAAQNGHPRRNGASGGGAKPTKGRGRAHEEQTIGVDEAAAEAIPAPLVAVDNTFMGPVFQHPIALGADVALYSATKYLSGFSDMLGGVILAADPDLIAQLRGMRAILGNILQPDECWLLDSRLPTVALRMNRQSKNAQRIAEALASHQKVKRMYYPTLFDDPEQIRIRDGQCRFPGAVFSIEIEGGKSAAFEFLRRLRIVRNAVSLGGVESLACHPASTTHSELSEEELRQSGVTDGLVRVSVGVEDWRDLLADFRQALDAA